MKRELPSGILLIVGSLMGIFAMSLHPSAHDMLTDQDGHRQQQLNMLIHGVAIASMPVLFLGLLGLARRLAPSDLATAALVAFGFGAVAVMIAGVASGFIATDLAHELVETESPSPADRDRFHELLGYTHSWNQAFTKVYVAATSAAFLLFSLAILRTRRLSHALGVAGILAGVGIALAVHFRVLRLDIHGFGLIVLVQSAWYVWVAVLLMRGTSGGSPSRPGIDR